MTQGRSPRDECPLQRLGGLMSVVTPVRNAADSLKGAVRSVGDQSVAVLEHIIVDDGSSDDTRGVAAALERTYPHIKLIRQPRRGAGPARNCGIAHASGRYIAFLDADDWWRERKVERQVGFMEEAGVVFTYSEYLKRNSATGSIIASYALPDSLGYDDLLVACPIGCLTAAYNQEVLGKRYMLPRHRAQDWALWLALMREGYRAWKYPGKDAVYNHKRRSLSSGKIGKGVDVYRIYRHQEEFGTLRSLYCLLRHVRQAICKP